MIKPVGSDELKPLFVYDPEEHHKLSHEAESLPSVVISSQAAGNAVMMGAGYFSPLQGFMNVADAMGAAEKMTLSDGSFFPVPVLCLLENTDAIGDAKRIALRDPNVEGNPVLAVMDIEAIEEVSDEQMAVMTDKVYRTTDMDHIGVKTFNSQGRVAVSGPIQVLNFSYFQADFPDTFRTAVEIRNEIKEHGWSKVVAFQTRNPMHRAHEELCRMAMESLDADGVVVHMLLGKLKKGDIPAPVRDAAIRTMAEVYFPPNTVMVTGYGFDMLYAGPREAVLHAYFRQNMGATHFIIGRDHAGVGDYYGAFDAQTIFDDEVPEGAMEIEIFRADHTAYSKKLNKIVMMRDVPDHTKEDFVLLSGTKVREMLGQGIAPPPEFSRPEVAKILMDYYQSINS
ncbi:sulfate adenylyltransferase [Candidatus Endoriftia persephone]|jgi:sulfate adenylyltransferase|uniref:Sulfate adenylyltransferase n=3 Tax=Gammaproteobacteria TaxID=1236 RepID=G2FD06_9GAMM|nr:sulfate adenylyltransferase [Candidatus Endoriftia persephone]EGV50710.1 ATP-sulfurylase [endosymbiont of Riftia pachyptila (vent Ph05)]EGW55386.1 ATP-sulfurylase [endosymbiont of Tevnia jerichonana (vent Tica)]USF88896.1 sulfate adenylyltransferase [Candidatus Endoriftia persephone]1JHD_A Chain A, Sulfate Adenylyltransferase [sulfur-oxidizing endosymbiont of Riftia pachyptila]